MDEITTQKHSKAKLSNGNTRESLIARLPIPGPGRLKETTEQKAVKLATKELLKRYERAIGNELPELSPILVAEAKKGNMQAFDQIHKIVGAYKKEGGNTIVPIQINFKDTDLV